MSKKNPVIRVVIADDHALIAEAIVTRLRDLPDIEIVAVVESGEEAIQKCREYQPDVALLDIQMPELNGIETALSIKHFVPQTKIIAITGGNDELSVLKMIQAGAVACLYKNMKFDLAQVLRLVMQNHTLMPDVVLEACLRNMYLPAENLEKSSPTLKFTGQELVVLHELMQGYTNKEIALHLDLSASTVKVHLSSIFRKLNVQTRTEAVAMIKIHNLLNQGAG